MSHAHDPSGQTLAHESDHSRLRPKYVNVDNSGLSMSWPTVVWISGGIIATTLAWSAFTAAIATKAEVLETTQIVLAPGAAPTTIRDVVQRHDAQARQTQEQLSSLGVRVDNGTTLVVSVRNGLYEDRAERLADRAADKVPDAQRSRAVWQTVRAKAAQNQVEGKPLREGLEQLLD